MNHAFRFVAVALAASAFALPAGLAAASGHVRIIQPFDRPSEGLALDRRGDAYVSFPNEATLPGEIRRIGRDGSQTVVTSFAVPGIGPLGLEFDRRGVLHAAVSTFDPATRGVYVIHRNGSKERLPGTGAIEFPNDVAFDRRGNAYVPDTTGGALWRISRSGAVERWFASSLLQGDGSVGFGFPIGANGAVYRHGAVYVTVTEGARIVRIAIRRDGSAGTASVVAQDPALYGADGIDARDGKLYVANVLQSTMLEVGRRGTIRMLAASEDGLSNPSSVVARGDKLWAVNFFTNPALLTVALDDDDDEDDDDD